MTMIVGEIKEINGITKPAVTFLTTGIYKYRLTNPIYKNKRELERERG